VKTYRSLSICSSNSSVLRAFSLISNSRITSSDAFLSAVDLTAQIHLRKHSHTVMYAYTYRFSAHFYIVEALPNTKTTLSMKWNYRRF